MKKPTLRVDSLSSLSLFTCDIELLTGLDTACADLDASTTD